MTTENQPTTMKDIAEKFGVSIATVSRALSGSKRFCSCSSDSSAGTGNDCYFVL